MRITCLAEYTNRLPVTLTRIEGIQPPMRKWESIPGKRPQSRPREIKPWHSPRLWGQKPYSVMALGLPLPHPLYS